MSDHLELYNKLPQFLAAKQIPPKVHRPASWALMCPKCKTSPASYEIRVQHQDSGAMIRYEAVCSTCKTVYEL